MKKSGPVNPSMLIPWAFFWHLPFCCLRKCPIVGSKPRDKAKNILCSNGQALIWVPHDHVFPLFIFLLFTGCLLFIISIFMCFCSRPFLQGGSPPGRIWNSRMKWFLFYLLVALLLFLLLLLLLSFIIYSKYFSNSYWLNSLANYL